MYHPNLCLSPRSTFHMSMPKSVPFSIWLFCSFSKIAWLTFSYRKTHRKLSVGKDHFSVCLSVHITSASNPARRLLDTRRLPTGNNLQAHWDLLSVRMVSRKCLESGRTRRTGLRDSTRISKPGLRGVEKNDLHGMAEVA
jgi:hypothetical protein